MQQSNAPAKIPTAFAASGTKRVPAATSGGIATPEQPSWDVGWPSITETDPLLGGIPPGRQDFNGLGFALSGPAQWAQAGGGYAYDSAFSASIGGYPKGAELLTADGLGTWRSVVDNNTTNPDAGGAGWVRSGGSLRDIRTFAGVVANGVADDFVALQNAINTALSTGVSIYWPAGVKTRVLFNSTTQQNIFIHGYINLVAENTRNSGIIIDKNYNHTPGTHAPLFCFGIASKGAAVDAFVGELKLGFFLASSCMSFERMLAFYEWHDCDIHDNYYDGSAVTWPLAQYAGGFMVNNIQPAWASGQSARTYRNRIIGNTGKAKAYYQNMESLSFTNFDDGVIAFNYVEGFSDDFALHGGKNTLVFGNINKSLLGRFYFEDVQHITIENNTHERCKDPSGAYAAGTGTNAFRLSATPTYAVANTFEANEDIVFRGNRVNLKSGSYVQSCFYIENPQTGLVVENNVAYCEAGGTLDAATGLISIVSTNNKGFLGLGGTGGVSSSTLVIASVDAQSASSIYVGMQVIVAGAPSGVFITAGSGGVGSYTMSAPLTIATGTAISGSTWTGLAGNPDFSNGGVVRMYGSVVRNNRCVGPGWKAADGQLGIPNSQQVGPTRVSGNLAGQYYAPYQTTEFDSTNRAIPSSTDPFMNVSSVSLYKSPQFVHRMLLTSAMNLNFANHPIGTPADLYDDAGLDFYAQADGSIRGFIVRVASAANGSNLCLVRVIKNGTQLGADKAFATIQPTTNEVSYNVNYFNSSMTFIAGDKIHVQMYFLSGETVAITGDMKMIVLYN